METKEDLIVSIKDWIKITKEIDLLKRKIKEKTEEKKHISEKLLLTMKSNEIDCFDISDGKIIYSQNKVKAPVSKKHLLSCLSEYFKKSNDPSAAQEMTKYILESRDTKMKDNIRFKEPK